MDFIKIVNSFSRYRFRNEDDVKIHFHSEIIKPILAAVNPKSETQYKSENNLIAGGRTDATFQNIQFEFKKYNYFSKNSGINEALYGRDSRDHGLYDYLLSNSAISESDTAETIKVKITSGIGVGFDGKQFIFARFVPSYTKMVLNTSKLSFDCPTEVGVNFIYEKKGLEPGLKKLALLLKQQNKMALNKHNLIATFNTKSPFVRSSILECYNEIIYNLNDYDGSSRVRTLFKEWDRVFGILYGKDEEATDFTEVTSEIKELYGIANDVELDSKVYLFAMQTFFNIFLKLLIYSFLSQLIDPSFSTKQELTKAEIDRLFDGSSSDTRLVNNFFEAHFLEWFTYTDREFDVKIINETLRFLDDFDLSSFVLKPEDVQDILQEVYMELIPTEMRHLMGEYFSPDWIVEHALEMVDYDGDINKTLIDPCAGSGPFLTQALKRIIARQGGHLTRSDLDTITHNIVGFDVNPISVVAAKANYILIIFSAFYDNYNVDFGMPLNIPVFIADSILAPVVYSEENEATLKIQTCVGDMELPKFNNFSDGNEFLTQLSHFIHEKADRELFINYVISKKLVEKDSYEVVKKLFDSLYTLHRSGKDSFWPIILKNSYAPIMIGSKFDYVVGNPPWIAWKSMSRSYREGTLKIWKSYGIFEKNAYDKKTTHDDFGMAVTYVSVDQYLKDNGKMVFLLPASFLKSTKGGEGFRKFRIIRNGQNVPFKIETVHDFSHVNLFTIPTIAIKIIKGSLMSYPLNDYKIFIQRGKKSKIDSHANWEDVKDILDQVNLSAQPVDLNNIQSAWITLKDLTFANKVLDPSKPRFYAEGRKGIEPAGAKGVYILEMPIKMDGSKLMIKNDISRQRRADIKDKGAHKGIVEEDLVYPMIGGRNISKWKVKSCEFMLVPNTTEFKYGIPEKILAATYPDTYNWLNYYHDELLASRIQNGKFFDPKTNPFYRLDNIGDYTFAPYKVLWKEQTSEMSAVVVSSYYNSIPNAKIGLFSEDKIIVVDSKVLMLGLDNEEEAYYVCGVLNARSITTVIDGYAISTNRGIDVLKYIAIPKYDSRNMTHHSIAEISKEIHIKAASDASFKEEEKKLDRYVRELF